MKKTFDAVAVMRKAREKLSSEWADKPRAEEVRRLREKHAPRIANTSSTSGSRHAER